MTSPTVSVVIATYNYGHYLPQALDSVLAQTFTDWEAIIVDDGSTDDTPQVMQAYVHDMRIHYIRTANAGQPAAENRGVRQSRGRFIAFLDADDCWMPPKLERQLKVFETTPSAGVVYTGRHCIDPQGRLLASRPGHFSRGTIVDRLFRNNCVCFSSTMVRREVFDDVGMFNEEYRHASDYDFWLRVGRRWMLDFVDEPLVLYRCGHANLTSRGDMQLTTALRIMCRFVDDCDARQRLGRSLVRLAFAETYCSLALAQRDNVPARALASYLKALCYRPYHYGAWRGLMTFWMPESLRRQLRRLLGRPIDWKRKPLIGEQTIHARKLNELAAAPSRQSTVDPVSYQ